MLLEVNKGFAAAGVGGQRGSGGDLLRDDELPPTHMPGERMLGGCTRWFGTSKNRDESQYSAIC